MSRVPLLFVDDQLQHRREAARVLKEHGYDVVEADSVETAITAVQTIANLCLVVSDLEIRGPEQFAGRGTAVQIHQRTGDIIRSRGGVFLVVTSTRLDALPGSIRADYCEEHGIRIFHRPVEWASILSVLADVRGRLAG